MAEKEWESAVKKAKKRESRNVFLDFFSRMGEVLAGIGEIIVGLAH